MNLHVNKHSKIVFRHPVIKGPDKKGKVICVGVAKLDSAERNNLIEGLEKLITLKPVLRSAVEKLDICEDAKKAYFGPIKAESGRRTSADPLGYYNSDAMRFVKKSSELDDEVVRLNRIIEGMQKRLGEREENAQNITLQECYDHWEKVVECASGEAKYNLTRNVKKVLTALGLTTKHAEVTAHAIGTACDEATTNATMRTYFRRDVKRFFRELSWPRESNGLGLMNPAEAVKQGTPPRGDVETFDPRPFLKSSRDAYWSALVAILGFGGLRLSECAGLEWEHLDEKEGLIHVRESAFHPELKSDMSERDVRPFPEVWEYVKKWKAVRMDDVLVFPREGPRGPSWFQERHGKARCVDLATALAAKLNEKEPARRLRRWWSTTMREQGYEHLIEAMAGHEDAVSRRHYTKWTELVKNAKIAPLTTGKK